MTRWVDIHGARHERPAGEPARWRISGYGLIERDGRLLMVEPVEVAWWVLPGGGINLVPEETILEGIVREVHEETGYRFTPDPATFTHMGDVFHHSRAEGFLRMVTFIVRGGVPDAPDEAWVQPEGEIRRVAWVEPAVLRRDHVHWHHWEILTRLGMVDGDG